MKIDAEENQCYAYQQSPLKQSHQKPSDLIPQSLAQFFDDEPIKNCLRDHDYTHDEDEADRRAGAGGKSERFGDLIADRRGELCCDHKGKCKTNESNELAQ